jgi:HPt (histidine-containing phosphotransfer) domain-containing protein
MDTMSGHSDALAEATAIKVIRCASVNTDIRLEGKTHTMTQGVDSPLPGSGAGAAATRPQNSASSMRKIFFIVGLAIAIFLAFTAYSVQKELQGRAQLAAIKELYFPVLQRLDADIVRLDKMEELYIQVVVAGDRDSLGKATDLAAQADQALGEIGKLYPARALEVAKHRASLKNYRDLATKAATAFLDQSVSDPAALTTGMNQALAEIRDGLKGFRAASYDEFVTTLAGSEDGARVRLLMGLALGVMNLGFMAVLVYFIRNNIRMMEVIAVQNATLEQRVAERTVQLSQKTSDINAMLQNMKLGVSTVIPGNRIHPEYSNYLTTIFCIDNLAGKDLIDSLFAKSDLGVDTKDQITASLGAILGEEAMMFDFNGHLLPGEMRIAEPSGARKTIQMDWSPIVNDQSKVEKVLLITQDVTHLRELEASSAQQKEELQIIANILRISQGKFNEFIESAAGFLRANHELIASAQGSDPEVIAALFRNMHTIKGNARTFQFAQITDAAHRAEQTYDRLRKDATAQWSSEQMLRELTEVESAVAEYVRINEETLGRKGRATDLMTTRGSFVSNEQLAQIRELAAAAAGGASGADLTRLRQAAERLGLISLERIVSGVADSSASLASELKKPAPQVEITGGEQGFNSQFAEALKSSFMHVIRNSLDHGIETPAERSGTGKPERGKVRIHCQSRGERVELRIGDDGRGLALHKLYEKGCAAGIFGPGNRPTPQTVAELIFRSGLSTATQVTQVSGRGVGMDAVRTFLAEQGATVRIHLAATADSELGFTPFEFVIDVPESAYTFAA